MYDYLVIGSGIAGLSVALAAAHHGKRVALVSKTHLEESNTRYAQGGIAAALGPGDSPQSHRDDTLVAGAGLCEADAVEALTSGAPARVLELWRLGVPFDREDSRFELGREGAHSANRILHAGGDSTGFNIEKTLAGAVRHSPNLTLLEEHFAADLLLENGRVAGARLRSPAGDEFEARARFTVLATGGAGQLYRYTTNPPVATGDGLALAYRAGAALSDLEFYQFHPTALNLPGAPSFLISEAVRGDGAILRNSQGEAFMTRYDQQAELAPRDIVARSIAREMARTGKPVYLDATHLGEKLLRHRFPQIYDTLRGFGLKMADQPIPVSPAAHYYMGGILSGLNGETTLPGLLTCGEAACNGVHGANRLASNSLLEGLVFGRRLFEFTEANPDFAPLDPSGSSRQVLSLPAPAPSINIEANIEAPTLPALQNLMWEKVGLERDEAGLREALATLEGWEARLSATKPESLAGLELRNLVTVGRLATHAALTRRESRGAHFRLDYPQPSPEWERHLALVSLPA